MRDWLTPVFGCRASLAITGRCEISCLNDLVGQAPTEFLRKNSRPPAPKSHKITCSQGFVGVPSEQALTRTNLLSRGGEIPRLNDVVRQAPTEELATPCSQYHKNHLRSGRALTRTMLQSRGGEIRTRDPLLPKQVRWPGCATPRFSR